MHHPLPLLARLTTLHPLTPPPASHLRPPPKHAHNYGPVLPTVPPAVRRVQQRFAKLTEEAGGPAVLDELLGLLATGRPSVDLQVCVCLRQGRAPITIRQG